MGGKGGLKKQKAPKLGSKKRPALVAAEEPAEEPRSAAKHTASAPSSAAKLPAFEPIGATHTDYSENETEDPAPMQLLDEPAAQAVKREVRRAQRPSGGVRPTPPGAGVLYLGHIPHGFYEEQMKGFFSQFGAVSRLRLARNKKTGRSKHYAFVEFKHRDVCEIVAKAMNGYLIFSKVLVAKVMEPEKVHPDTFKGADRPFKVVDRVAIVRKQHNRERSAEEATKRTSHLVKAERKRRKQLDALGIDYAFGGYEAAVAERPAAKPRAQLSDAAADDVPTKAVSDEPAAGAAAGRKRKTQQPSVEAAPTAEAQAAEAAAAPKKKTKKAAAAPTAAAEKEDQQAPPPTAAVKRAAPKATKATMETAVAKAQTADDVKVTKKKKRADVEAATAAEPAPKKAAADPPLKKAKKAKRVE